MALRFCFFYTLLCVKKYSSVTNIAAVFIRQRPNSSRTLSLAVHKKKQLRKDNQTNCFISLFQAISSFSCVFRCNTFCPQLYSQSCNYKMIHNHFGNKKCLSTTVKNIKSINCRKQIKKVFILWCHFDFSTEWWNQHKSAGRHCSCASLLKPAGGWGCARTLSLFHVNPVSKL